MDPDDRLKPVDVPLDIETESTYKCYYYINVFVMFRLPLI